MASPVMSMTLPPLANLPQWQRVQSLDKARYPRPFLKDQIPVLPPTNSSAAASSSLVLHTDSEILDTSGSDAVDPAQRLHHMERSMEFLKRQHHEVLVSLHQEIDELKRENKELQFKVIMARTSSPKKESSSSSIKSEGELVLGNSQLQAQKIDQLKMLYMEDKVKELTVAVQDARGRNSYLQRLLKDAVEKRPPSQEAAQQTSPAEQNRPSPPVPVSMDPLKVQGPGDPQPRAPTLEECGVIIRHLQEHGDRQSRELSQLKSDLKDVLYSHKWTPDAYLLAKAYVADEDPSAGDSKLPRISLKNQSKKIPEAAFSQTSFSLPPLTQTMGNKVAERQKRVEAVKRARQQRKEVIL
ncbi:coiled-coil domain-containing protein 74A-like [Acanthaster planci]|uniref:Coiled-coil domain-containing protein 74A-like n=1 Tax=Acanthaster planci TaxID=133434 RepID=A0A8B7YRB4_ACAPL|nr:coiled-coil domain-containing protein 74A-like [Acanthaster planci]